MNCSSAPTTFAPVLADEPSSPQAGALLGGLCRASHLALDVQEEDLLQGVVLVQQVLHLPDGLDDLLHGVVDEEGHREVLNTCPSAQRTMVGSIESPNLPPAWSMVALRRAKAAGNFGSYMEATDFLAGRLPLPQRATPRASRRPSRAPWRRPRPSRTTRCPQPALPLAQRGGLVAGVGEHAPHGLRMPSIAPLGSDAFGIEGGGDLAV